MLGDKTMRKTGLTLTMLALLVGYVSAGDEKISIGSGSTVGMYYSTSSAVAKLFNYKRQDYHQWVVTVASAGSEENINEVLNGTVQFGFSQANVLDKALHGVGPWKGKPHQNLRVVLTLYPEELTIVAAEDAKIAQLSDLKGKRVNIGAPGSSTQDGVRRLIKNIGIPLEEITLVEEPSSRASDLLEDGKIDAYFFTVGHPSFSIWEASAGKRKVRLVPLNPAQIDEATASSPFVKAVTIPLTYCPKLTNTSAIPTVGTPAVLFTHEGMSDETVYRLVKEVMTNLDLFRRQQPVLRDLEAKEMATPVVVPLHPGAERYFKEAGLLP
jgi:TRAP transporter TAXI family solute receptor